MKWSIFDPKNRATLNEVRQKFDVSEGRLRDLRKELVEAKLKVQISESRFQHVNQPTTFAKEIGRSFTVSRRDIFHTFNEDSFRGKLRTIMQQGVSVAYVGNVSKKIGATRVYKLEVDRSGRIRVASAIPDNPQKAVNSGFYAVTIVDPAQRMNPMKTFKSRAQTSGLTVGAGGRRRRKPRVHFEAELKKA